MAGESPNVYLRSELQGVFSNDVRVHIIIHITVIFIRAHDVIDVVEFWSFIESHSTFPELCDLYGDFTTF